MSFLGFPCFVAILKRTLAKECIGLGMRLRRAYHLKRLPEGMQNKRIPWCRYMWFRGYTVELLQRGALLGPCCVFTRGALISGGLLALIRTSGTARLCCLRDN